MMTGVGFECPGAEERIQQLALAVSGLSQAPQAANALFDAAVGAALAICGRDDVPRAMEPALGIILAALFKDGMNRPVSAVKRGDTSITYALNDGGLNDTRALLAPFMRLRAL